MAKSPGIIAETKNGKVEGFKQGGLYVFKGLPYASPPTGERRWLAPQPVEGWREIRQAKRFAPASCQNDNQDFLRSLTAYSVAEARSEDCLYLNIWTPGLDDQRRPVLFWIHGGAFGYGAGSEPIYEGTSLATRGNAVVVTINYRLGLFGFLRLIEATGGKIPSTGNEGLLDPIAALEWVRDNIANFGGDPDNVTIFGESAGGVSVGCLLAMPRARGLFHKAIIQSGGANGCMLPEGKIRFAKRLIELLGLPLTDADALRKVPVTQLFEAYRKYVSEGGRPPMRPVIDGTLIAEMPIVSIERGSAKEIPILLGTTQEEWKLVCNTSTNPNLPNMDEAELKKLCLKYAPPDRIGNLIETYRKSLAQRGAPNTAAEIWVAIQSDGISRIPAIRLAEAQGSNNPSVYSYLFTWKSAQEYFGSCHALELGFVFGTYEKDFCGVGPAANILSQKIQDGWLAFARSGDPSCESLGKWLPYTHNRNTMMLGEKCYLAEVPYEAERRAWDFVSNATWTVP